MLHARIRQTLVALILLAGVFAGVRAGTITDGPTTRTYEETFESFNSGAVPTDSWYTITTTGSGVQQVFNPAPGTMGKAWRLDDTAVGYAAQMNNLGSGVDLCAAGQTFAWKFNLGSPTGVGQSQEMRLVAASAVSGATAPVNSIGVLISGQIGSENIVSYVRGSSGTVAIVTHTAAYVAGGTVSVTISQINCGGAGASAVFTYTGAVTFTDTVTDDVTLTGTLNRFNVASTGSSPSGTPLYVDDVTWAGAPIPSPTVSSVSPNGGPTAGGTSVTVTGTNFVSGATITFGGAAATDVVFVSSTTLTATTPAHAAGAVDVVVMNPGGSGTLTNGYTYQNLPSPTISTVSPNTGPTSGGTSVTISGTNFQSGASVKLGSNFAYDVVVASATSITATTPPGGGTVDVVVTNPDGQVATKANSFTYEGTAESEVCPDPELVPNCEDFESFSTGAVPTQSWYTFTRLRLNGAAATSTALVSAEQSLGEKSLRAGVDDDIDSNTAYFRYNQFTTSQSICRTDANVVTPVYAAFRFSGTADTNSGSLYLGATANQPISGSNSFVRVAVTEGSEATLIMDGGANAVFSPSFVLTTDKWYDLTMVFDCYDEVNGVAQFITVATITDRETGTIYEAFAEDTNFASTPDPTDFLGFGLISADKVYLDNLGYGDRIPTGIRLIASRSVNNLRGFDVDSGNYAVITREDNPGGGQRIFSYNPTNLEDLSGGGFEESDCERDDGVSVLYARNSAFLTFANCNSGGFVDRLHIRSQTMDVPDFSGTICDGDDFCEDDIETGSLTFYCGSSDQLPGGLRDLGRFEAIRWDWSYSTTDGVGNGNEALLSWAFTDPAGSKVGIYTQNQVDGDSADCSEVATVTYPNDDISDFCSWRDTSTARIVDGKLVGDDYLAAVSSDGPTRVYRVTDNTGEPNFQGGFDPSFSITALTSGNPTVDNSVGVGCGRDRMLLLTAAGAVHYIDLKPNFRLNFTLPSVTNPHVAGAALSASGFTGAIAANGVLHFYDFRTRQEVGSIPMPDGTHVDVILDSVGQIAWEGTSDFLEKYDISQIANTSQLPPGAVLSSSGSTVQGCTDSQGLISPDCNNQGDFNAGTISDGAPPAAPSGFFGDEKAELAITLGSELAAGWYLALFFIVGLAIGLPLTVGGAAKGMGFNIPGKGFFHIAVAGAGIGLVTSWVFNLVDTVTLFVALILILGPIVAFTMYQGRSV